MSDSLLPYGLWSARLLCSWNSGILEWVAISFSRRSSWPRDQTRVSYTAGRFFTIWATREAPWRPKPLFKSLPGSKWWLHHWYIYGFGQVLWLLGAHSFTFKGEKWCLIPCLHVCKDGSRCELLSRVSGTQEVPKAYYCDHHHQGFYRYIVSDSQKVVLRGSSRIIQELVRNASS